ncbi:protein UPSTREAM OF FLC-like [Dorcoceras hygrometricum]|uniref:Protein UPSTREAM OF FLC-like n=1 Tax=Dorcoceras hygrometricum TaxID=472368 RepID=A0A2Z7CRB1_9LAMI|nr:protein UPSTREAM OF FLC-like [Dorcoceras hygrometricum]
MEGRMRRQRQVSPERAMVWSEKSPKYRYNHHHNQHQQQKAKVPVVYYLCRNSQLEHPHFMEVPLTSPDGLYLRDVMERLNWLRGRGIASMYSWSCKRSYKNGFVWHDLCADDLILPSHGNEYVLKGSEFFEESNSVIIHLLLFDKGIGFRLSQEESSSSSSLNGRATKNSQDDEISPPLQRPCSFAMSPESSTGKNSPWNGSLSLTEYKIYANDGLADASTQTEENASRTIQVQDTCTRGVSTDDWTLDTEPNDTHQRQIIPAKVPAKICRDVISPPPSTSSASSSGRVNSSGRINSSGRVNTLEALIRADAVKLNSFSILEEEEFRMPSNVKHKATNIIMQLISCGSFSVKDHSFGLIPTYRPRFSHSKFSSPLFSTSSMLGDLDCLAESSRIKNAKLEDKEYFSSSFAEMSMYKEGIPTLQRSSSDNAGRNCQQIDPVDYKEETSSVRVKCIPRSIKASSSTQPKSESIRSPLSEVSRISSDTTEVSRSIISGTSNDGSKRSTEPLMGRKQSKKPESFRNEEENVIKIEES